MNGHIPDGCAFLQTNTGNKLVFTANTDGTISLVNLSDTNPTPILFGQSTKANYGDISGIGPDGCWYITAHSTAGYASVPKICPPGSQTFDETNICTLINDIRLEMVGASSQIKLFQPSCPGEVSNFLLFNFQKIDELDTNGVVVNTASIGYKAYTTITRSTAAKYRLLKLQAPLTVSTATVTSEVSIKYYTDTDIINNYYIIPSTIKFDYNLLTAWPFASTSNQLQYTIEIKTVDYTCALYPYPLGGHEVILNLGLPNYAKVYFPATVMIDGVSKNIISISISNSTGSCKVFF